MIQPQVDGRGESALPPDGPRPVFQAPWQAQVFALTLALHARGLFTWAEWAQALSQAITRAQQAGDPDTGETYYRHWLDALRRLVLAKGVGHARTLSALEEAWQQAADRTPHGQAIELAPQALALARDA